MEETRSNEGPGSWILQQGKKPLNSRVGRNGDWIVSRDGGWIWVDRVQRNHTSIKSFNLSPEKNHEGAVEFRIGIRPTAENIRKAYTALLPLLMDSQAPFSMKFVDAAELMAVNYAGWDPECGKCEQDCELDQRGKEICFYVTWKKTSQSGYQPSLDSNAYKRFMLKALKALIDAGVEGIAYYPSIAADHSLAADETVKTVTYLDYTSSDKTIWKHRKKYEKSGFSDPLKNIIITEQDYLKEGITKENLNAIAYEQKAYARKHFYSQVSVFAKDLENLCFSEKSIFNEFTDKLEAPGKISIGLLEGLSDMAFILKFASEHSVFNSFITHAKGKNQSFETLAALKESYQNSILSKIENIEANNKLDKQIKNNQIKTQRTLLQSINEFPANIIRLQKERAEAEKHIQEFVRNNASHFDDPNLNLSDKSYDPRKIIMLGHRARFLTMEKNIIDESNNVYRQTLRDQFIHDPSRSGWQKIVDWVHEYPVASIISCVLFPPIMLMIIPAAFSEKSSAKPADAFIKALNEQGPKDALNQTRNLPQGAKSLATEMCELENIRVEINQPTTRSPLSTGDSCATSVTPTTYGESTTEIDITSTHYESPLSQKPKDLPRNVLHNLDQKQASITRLIKTYVEDQKNSRESENCLKKWLNAIDRNHLKTASFLETIKDNKNIFKDGNDKTVQSYLKLVGKHKIALEYIDDKNKNSAITSAKKEKEMAFRMAALLCK